MEEAGTATPHVLVLSFPGQGHINPLLRLAKFIAAKGLLVTFCCTADAGKMILSSTDNSAPAVAKPVGEGFLRLEFPEDWIFGDPLRDHPDTLLANIRSTGHQALVDLVRRQADAGRPVSCVINSPFLPWVLDVVGNMGIPVAVLWIQSFALFTFYYYHHQDAAAFRDAEDSEKAITLPGLSMLKNDAIPTFLFLSDPYKFLMGVILEQFDKLSQASWVFANSFEELERDTIVAISERVPIIPIGPLTELDEKVPSSIRGDLYKAADCMEWLDAEEPRSVVYVSLGSIAMVSKEQMTEMAYGLRASAQPFLWVVRERNQALLPEGFVEEIKDKGLVVGWCPQDGVLAHGAVGCFLTHCGWNSTIETITAGVPVIAFPQWGDQVTNAKFLVDIYRVGVRLNAPAVREEVEQCVKAVMSGTGAEEMRRRAAEWKEAAKKAVAAGGSSDRNIQAFVDEIRRRN